MKKRTTIIAAIAAVIALSAVPLVYAQHHMRGHDDGFGAMGFGRLERIRTALDLSDAQVEQLKQIAGDLRTQNAPYRQQMRGGMLQIVQTLAANPNDLSTAQSLLDQQSQNERAMKQNTLNAAAKAMSVLTPEQRTKVADFLAKRAAAHERQK